MGGSDYKAPPPPQTSTDLNNPGGANQLRKNLLGGGIPGEPINPKLYAGLGCDMSASKILINPFLLRNIKTHPDI